MGIDSSGRPDRSPRRRLIRVGDTGDAAQGAAGRHSAPGQAAPARRVVVAGRRPKGSAGARACDATRQLPARRTGHGCGIIGAADPTATAASGSRATQPAQQRGSAVMRKALARSLAAIQPVMVIWAPSA
jgi:hypothetical protein